MNILATNFFVEIYKDSEFLQEFVYQFEMNFIRDNRWKLYLEGLGVTLLITFFALIIGVVIGTVVAAVRSTYDKNYKNMKPSIGKVILSILNRIFIIYLTIIRGTPVVIQLMIFYFVVFASAPAEHGMYIAAITFGINSGAYVAEIFRSGIMSIDQGQEEAGRSLGFNYIQTMFYIILPQAFKNVLPTLANEFIVLLKETAVCGYVGVMDLTRAADKVRAVTWAPFMPLVGAAIIYLAMVMILTWLVGKLERRLRNDER